MVIRAVLVDDSAVDLEHAARLNRDELLCVPLSPPPTGEDLRRTLQNMHRAGECDVVLLDYRLDAETSAGARRDYRGGSVAAILKEHIPDLPIVLVTTEQKFRSNLRGKPEVRGLFDHTVLKQRIASRAARPTVVLEITDLAAGFQRIRASEGAGWDRVSAILSANGDASTVDALEVSSPPIGTTEIAQWVLHGLIAYTSILLDEADGAAALGLALSSFNRPEVRSAIEAARYEGVFSRWHERWWRGRLQRWVTSLADDRPGLGGADRAPLVAAHLGLSRAIVRSATCVWCGGKNVTRACSVCRQPVDPQHALPALIDDRPRWVDGAHVCFDCIRRGRIENARFQKGTESVVRALRSGTLTPEASSDR